MDQTTSKENRKICLLLDNCSSHKIKQQLNSIELVYLPANTTATIQPLDQGIIRNFKHYYRKQLVEKVLIAIDSNQARSETPKSNAISIAKKINILDALAMLKLAWENVKPDTIINCFKAGLKKKLIFLKKLKFQLFSRQNISILIT